MLIIVSLNLPYLQERKQGTSNDRSQALFSTFLQDFYRPALSCIVAAAETAEMLATAKEVALQASTEAYTEEND